jgi:hypothetical protein
MKYSLSRAFFVGIWIQEALEEHASPPITCMLLRMNADIISTYLDEKYRRREWFGPLMLPTIFRWE